MSYIVCHSIFGFYNYCFIVLFIITLVRRGDVLSAWSGIRPLVSDPNKEDTQSLARNHIVHISDSGLITIAGGKWTTYRAMASETIDAALKSKTSFVFIYKFFFSNQILLIENI